MRAASLALLALVSVALAIALRVHRIGEQMIMEDEWHGLLTLREHGWRWLASHFGESDHCIPLTLWTKLLDAWLGIDELTLRLVPLACGSLVVLVVPLALPHAVARGGVRALLVPLLGVSPLLVHHSRYARPYMPALLLSWGAILALHRWCEGRRRRDAVAFALCAGFAVWLLPVVAPFVLAAWLATLREQRTLWLGLGAGAVGSALLGPALITDVATLAAKAAHDTVGAATLDGALSLWFGVEHRVLAGVLLIASAHGWLILRREAPVFARIVLVAMLAQIVAIVASRAQGVQAPFIFARYGLPVVPGLLLGVARSAIACTARLGARAGPALVPIALVVTLVLMLEGPWRSAYWFPNQWTGHLVWQGDYESARDELELRLQPRAVSQAYEMLAARAPGTETIAETPFPQDFTDNPFTLLQRFHHQRVVGAMIGELVPGALRHPAPVPGKRAPRWTAAVTDLDGLRARGVRWVVVHRDLPREFPMLRFVHPTDAAPVVSFLRAGTGAPVFEDEQLTVFELAR